MTFFKSLLILIIAKCYMHFYTLGITAQARVIVSIIINWVQIDILRVFLFPNIQDDFYVIFCKLTCGLNGDPH